MWTIENRKIIRGAAEHEAAGLGKAVDYVAVFEDIASPVDGVVNRIYTGVEGGNWLWIVDAKERTWKFAHLESRMVLLNEKIKKGEIIGVSGATGKPKPPLPPYKPHLHLEVWQNGQRQDPEIIIRELLNSPMPDYNNKIIQNQEAGTPEAGEFSLVRYGKRRRITQERAGLASLDAQKSEREIVGVNSAVYHSIPQGLDF